MLRRAHCCPAVVVGVLDAAWADVLAAFADTAIDHRKPQGGKPW